VYRIEPLQPADVTAIAAIEEVDGDVHWSAGQFEKELTLDFSRFFVLRDEGNILGYGGFWKVGDDAQITNVVIARSARQKGLGKSLMNHLMQQATQAGCRSMTLEVRQRNQAALALYTVLGFETQAQRTNAYGAPIDNAILMVKWL
jgi:[ribosomal protein S18]-alanine N-acetyltransferase